VAPFAEVKLAPPKVANVWVRFGEQRWNEKSLSLYMTMKELRGNDFSLEKLVFRVLHISKTLSEKLSFTVGLPASKLRLWHIDIHPMLMRFPAKRLYSYNLKDGDEILIDEKLG
jgi:hypothetical protein